VRYQPFLRRSLANKNKMNSHGSSVKPQTLSEVRSEHPEAKPSKKVSW
jgi:hypothetical protein